MLAGNSPDRYYQIPDAVLQDRTMVSKGETDNVNLIKIIDEWSGFAVSLELDKPALLWRFPIETVSQSESGMERTYQSSVVMPSWKLRLKPNESWKVKMILRIEE